MALWQFSKKPYVSAEHFALLFAPESVQNRAGIWHIFASRSPLIADAPQQHWRGVGPTPHIASFPAKQLEAFFKKMVVPYLWDYFEQPHMCSAVITSQFLLNLAAISS